MTENAGTTPEEGQAPANESGTGNQPDEVTTLRSRNAGLDAKVTELQRTTAAETTRANAAEARALALAEAGTNGDAELRAQLEAQKLIVAKSQQETALARIEAKYPETFAVLGETAASLTADQLAAAEARFAGVGSESSSQPTPLGNNPQRPLSGAPKALTDMSLAELEQSIRRSDPALMYQQSRD